MTDAKRTDPELWEQVKKDVTQSDKGGDPGEWSARKAQMAVQEYKKRGGGYSDDGPDQDETSLHEWTEEDWGTKSGGESGETGERYLPKKVRMLLTEDEYRRSTAKKRSGDDQYVDQPEDVRKKVSHIKENGPTKAMLEERAEDLGLSGSSSKTKDELLSAIEEATDGNGRKKGSEAALENETKDALLERARRQDIEGRSGMTKDELVSALADADRDHLSEKTKDELYEMAQERDIEGRSDMTKEDLIDALS
ncbi:Rho termination factor N-terminal domain-containing protein [Parvularcula oceani]|uniref:Rho termination factor N-terminal domain-containing protein n=1 Tax=Parvularcula oceani TaxID=1247963 RepID=UPI000A507DA2|nr:Rho termination factor N-terminal domain-containing protein [Parvularcula oceani]